ncbi:MAG: GspH/FimT family pseudopilin [Gammaproteobacteria bacterium]
MSGPSGFTLIELMVTVAVAAILVTVAVPSFQTMIESNGLTSQVNQFITALNGARSEAVKRGKQITLCKSADGNGCGGSTIGYEAGWIVFVDDNQDGVRQTTEELLRFSGALKQSYTLRESNNFVTRISFKPSGEANSLGTFVLCKDNNTSKSRTVIVIRTGRMRSGQDTDKDGIPEGGDGNEITSCAV